MFAVALAAAVAYAPQQVGTVLAAGEPVGHVRAGLLCLPKGTLRWRDIGIAERLDQRQIVNDALEAEDLPVAALAHPSGSIHRVRGTVTKVVFDMCARNWGLGGANALSGKAGLEVAWRVENGATADLAHVSQVVRTVDKDRAAPAAEIYRDMLAEAARDLAKWLKAGGHDLSSRTPAQAGVQSK